MTAVHNDPPHAAGIVVGRLHVVRRRLWAFFFLYWCRGLFAFASVAVLAFGIVRFFRGEPVWNLWSAIILLWLPVSMAFLMTFGLNGSVRALDHAALSIDHLAETHNRFHTALILSRRVFTHRTLLENLALEECAGFIRTFDYRPFLPVRPTRAWLFAAAPLVSLALLAWQASLGIGQPPSDQVLTAAVANRADALAATADRLHHEGQKTPSPELEKIAEAMKRSAERLRDSQRQADEQKLKTALGELSSLEGMLAAMKQAAKDEKISPGELAALAAALAASAPAKTAGEAIKQGRLEQAGDQLEKLAEQMKAQGGDSAQALQELAQSMQEQAAKLSDQEKNEVARQMQQAAQSAQNGQAQLSANAMQRLAELLKKAGKNGAKGAGRQASSQSGASGGPMSEQQLQDLLNALENAKEGLQPNGEGQAPGSPDGGQEGRQSLALVESFAKQSGGDPHGGEKPSGMPGSEHDEGTNDHLLADRAADAPKPAGPSKRLEGMLGDGASLRELVGAASGPARAGRPYRDLYEAIAPAEQNSVEQENIPLGSRVFVRRYFENIRPQN